MSSSNVRRGARLVQSWLGALRRPAVRRRAARIGQGRPRPAPGELAPDELSSGGVSRRAIEALVGAPVGELELYDHALRHRSIFRGQTTDGTESNERLEFLGDAVLGAVVAEHLYRDFPHRDEGFLTRTRANLVNGKTLAGFAASLGIDALVQISDNMEASDGRRNATILADAFEAIVGAVYLDLGFAAAKRFVCRVLETCVDVERVAAQRSNHKSQLLEFVQARGLAQPTYDVVSEEGPSHERRFTVAAIVEGRAWGEGAAGSKKQAEQAAAREALAALAEADAG